MKAFLTLTAAGEAATGLALLAYPQGVVRAILGGEAVGDGLVMSRVAGAALVAFGVACWSGRSANPAPLALPLAALIYDLTAAAVLAHAGIFANPIGPALWPAVIAHAALAVWCVVCIWNQSRGAGDHAKL